VIAGPTVWNTLPDELRVVLTVLNSSLRQSCLVSTNVIPLNEMRYTKLHVTYLFTF